MPVRHGEGASRGAVRRSLRADHLLLREPAEEPLPVVRRGFAPVHLRWDRRESERAPAGEKISPSGHLVWPCLREAGAEGRGAAAVRWGRESTGRAAAGGGRGVRAFLYRVRSADRDVDGPATAGAAGAAGSACGSPLPSPFECVANCNGCALPCECPPCQELPSCSDRSRWWPCAP